MQKKFVALCLLASVSGVSVLAMDRVEVTKPDGSKETVEKNLVGVVCQTSIGGSVTIPLSSISSSKPADDSKAPLSFLYPVTFQHEGKNANTTLQNYVKTEVRDEVKRIATPSSSTVAGIVMMPKASDIELVSANETQQAVTVRQGFDYLSSNASHPLSGLQKIIAGLIVSDWFLKYAGVTNSISLMGTSLAQVGQVKGISTVVGYAATKCALITNAIAATKVGIAAAPIVPLLALPFSAFALAGAGYVMYQASKPGFENYCHNRRVELQHSYVVTKAVLGNKISLGLRYGVANLCNTALSPLKIAGDAILKGVS